MKPKKLKSTRWRARLRKRPMTLRHEALREVLCRLVLLGLSAGEIARKLHRTSRAIRYAISTPEFAARFEAYRHEQFRTLDRKIHALLPAAVDALARLLRHKDWRARDAAIEKVMKAHTPLLERIAGQRPLDPPGSVSLIPAEAMTDEMRAKARELYVGGRWGRRGRSHRLPHPGNALEGRGLPRFGRLCRSRSDGTPIEHDGDQVFAVGPYHVVDESL